MSITNNPIILADIWGKEIEDQRKYHIKRSEEIRKSKDPVKKKK